MTRTTLIDNRPEIKGAKLIVGYLGIFLMLIGLITLLPLIMLIFYPQEWMDMWSFIIPGLSSLFAGGILTLLFKGRKKGRLHRKQGIMLVVGIWVLAILITAIPYSIGRSNVFLNYAQSIFETTSGFATTCLTMVSSPETLGHVFLFHRSLTVFFGGVGLVLVLTSAISDQFGLSLYYAEGHSDQFLPNLVKSARFIMGFYSLYVLLGTIAYVLFGMEPFDALNHSICAVGTGGFSTKANSIGYYSDPTIINMFGIPSNGLAIEIISMILMLLGATNFLVPLYICQRKIKQAFNNYEFKLLIIEIVIFLPVVIALTFNNFSVATLKLEGIDAFLHSVRLSTFHFISAATTTGYSTISITSPALGGVNTYYSSAILLIFVISMLIGGNTNSTAGGMKQSRIGLFFISIYWTIRDFLSRPNTIRSNYVTKYNEKVAIDDKEIKANNIYIGVYLSLVIVCTLIFCCFGYSLMDSLFEVSTAISSAGLSVGIVNNLMNPFLMWIEIILMFLGRLEIYIVFIFIAKLFDFKDR